MGSRASRAMPPSQCTWHCSKTTPVPTSRCCATRHIWPGSAALGAWAVSVQRTFIMPSELSSKWHTSKSRECKTGGHSNTSHAFIYTCLLSHELTGGGVHIEAISCCSETFLKIHNIKQRAWAASAILKCYVQDHNMHGPNKICSTDIKQQSAADVSHLNMRTRSPKRLWCCDRIALISRPSSKRPADLVRVLVLL